MRRRRIVALLGVLLIGASGCSASIELGNSTTGMPRCPLEQSATPDHVSSALVLVAQSVPTASRLPCVRALAVGWTFQRLNARSDRAQFFLNSDREGSHAVSVTLTRSCDVTGAAEVASDEPGTRRYERSDTSTSRLRADQYYRYDGGCTTYHLNLKNKTGAEPMQAISDMLRLVDRELLRQYVHHYSGGRFELDAAHRPGT
jgi:hypothetical protein